MSGRRWVCARRAARRTSGRARAPGACRGRRAAHRHRGCRCRSSLPLPPAPLRARRYRRTLHAARCKEGPARSDSTSHAVEGQRAYQFRSASDGANLVITAVMRSTPDQHDPDWPRYPETILSFSTSPAIEIDLRAAPTKATIDSLAAAGFGEPFAVLTAFDPRGENLSAEENDRRKRDLDDRLRAMGHRF